MTEDYYESGFYDEYVLIDYGGYTEKSKKPVKVCEDDDLYAYVIINNTYCLADWLEDEEIYCVFMEYQN